MTISHLQIAVFLNSHPGSAFGRPVVMAGLRPAMTTGDLENVIVQSDSIAPVFSRLLRFSIYLYCFIHA